MSYRSYITDVLVCGSRPLQTSDRSYLLLTRDAGMIYATAKSVREERSKQRFALQEFSLARATLIHGRLGWKIAGVEPGGNLFLTARNRAERALVCSLVMLVRRTMHGEEAHPQVYDDLTTCLAADNQWDINDRELVMTLRLLYHLGYIASTGLLTPLLDAKLGNNLGVRFSAETRAAAQAAITRALAESHL